MILDIKTALSIASMIELTDGKNPVQALKLIKITLKDNTLTAIATDRYVLGKMTIPVDNTDNEDFTVYWNSDTAKYLKDRSKLITSLDLTASHFVSEAGTYLMAKNISYPTNVENMFDNLDAHPLSQPLNVNLSYFTKVAKLLTPDQATRTPSQRTKPVWSMLATGEKENKMPKPILLTNEDSTIQVLLQPNARRA